MRAQCIEPGEHPLTKGKLYEVSRIDLISKLITVINDKGYHDGYFLERFDVFYKNGVELMMEVA